MSGASHKQYSAVIFDMGGVVIASPVQFLQDYQKSCGLPPGTFVQTIVRCTEDSAWAEWERGDLNMDEFGAKFSQECSQLAGRPVDLSRFPYDLEEASRTPEFQPYPEMLEAARRLRAAGIKTAVLTNNVAFSDGPAMLINDRSIYDCIVESARVRMRKPEERIYRYTLDKLNVEPSDAIFLDDLESNVVAAQRLGMTGIKVTSTQQALRDLEKHVGIPLL